MAISMILLVLAFIAPWYHFVSTFPSSYSDIGVVFEDRFYVDNWQREFSVPPLTTTLDYDEDVGTWEALGDVMMVEIVLLLAAVAATGAAAAALFVRRGRVGTVLCAVGVVLLAVIVLYFYLMVPRAVAESVPGLYSVVELERFWGEWKVSTSTFNWGPMVGWYLVIAAAFLEFAALALLSSRGDRGPQIY
jgi:hypothetical protein